MKINKNILLVGVVGLLLSSCTAPNNSEKRPPNSVKLTLTQNDKDAGTLYGAGYYEYNSYVDISTVVNEGYTFNGWYLGQQLLSRETSFKYMLWEDDVTINAVFSINQYQFTVKTHNSNNGTVLLKEYNPQQYYNSASIRTAYKSSVTVSEYTKSTHRFLGWYDSNNNLVSSKSPYTFNMPHENYLLEAKWNYFTISYNLNGGTNSTINPTYYHVEDGVIYLQKPTRENYYFLGWKRNGEYITEIDCNCLENISLDADWVYDEFTITYNLNGGINNPNNPETYSSLDTIVFSEATKQGYTFLGWYDDNNNKVTEIGVGMIGDITLTARWASAKNNLYITSEDTAKGTVEIVSGSGYSNESITVVASPVGNCVFKGWYHESIKVSNEKTYTFIMPINDYSLVAHFFTKDEEDEYSKKYAIKPQLSEDEKTVEYGLYPQTNVSDPLIISELEKLEPSELNGWYLYDGDYYAKTCAVRSGAAYLFDNGEKIETNKIYWFKCETIRWNILSADNAIFFVVSSMLIDAYHYTLQEKNREIDGNIIYRNNYEYSDIRSWLNDDFLNCAFALGKSNIQTVIVDNSASSSGHETNNYACANTEESIFLPSRAEYMNISFGFLTNETRRCKTTDWTRASGGFVSDDSSHQYCGKYWTRSPSNKYASDPYGINFDGSIVEVSFPYVKCDVRPCMFIEI